MQFEWDKQKAGQNLIKHGVAFEEASTVFGDTLSITIYDKMHSIKEDRFITIGMSRSLRILVVVHADLDDIVRIISSRVANKSERNQYEPKQ